MPDPSVDETIDLDALDALDFSEAPAGDQPFLAKLRKNVHDAKRYADRQTRRAEAAEQELANFKTQGQLRETAKSKGLDDEQVEMLLSLKPDATVEQMEAFAAKFVPSKPAETEEGEAEAPEPQAPQGFVPSPGGSHVPATPYSDEDFGRALQRGDTAAITRMAAEAAKDPKRLDLKWAHLIED